jgi:AcrR family transcriptional regulator
MTAKKPAKRRPESGDRDDTRSRIVAAALQTLRADGIAGLSARAIARHGGFNQALIFYHFGSLEGLLVAVARSESERRSALYAPALREVNTVSELVAVAGRLHEEEFRDGNVAALTQMLAGASRSEDLADGIRDALQPWTDLVGETIERLVLQTPYADILPHEDLTAGVTALFLGIELFTGLHPSHRGDNSLFKTMDMVAAVLDGFLRTTATTPAAPPVDDTPVVEGPVA